MISNLARGGIVLAVALALSACTGGDADKKKFEAAAAGLAEQRDKALDSTGTPGKVDTTKLGAAKTESILAKARKTP
jgi:hypothetical protein